MEEIVPLDLLLLRKVLNSLMVAFPGYCDSVRTLGKAPFRCRGTNIFSIAKVWLLAGD